MYHYNYIFFRFPRLLLDHSYTTDSIHTAVIEVDEHRLGTHINTSAYVLFLL